MDNIHPDDNIITVIALTTKSEVIEIQTPASKMHDVYIEWLNPEGYTEYMTLVLPGWYFVMVWDDFGKDNQKDINWAATFILQDAKRIADDDFVNGDVILLGEADDEGYETSISREKLIKKWPGIFAGSPQG